MTTKQIALRMIEFCAKKKFTEARHELFNSDILSYEADNKQLKGIHALDKKHEKWMGTIKKLHGIKISSPLVNGNFFSIGFTWDVTYKRRQRSSWKEIGTYEVKNGKIVMERYFYEY